MKKVIFTALLSFAFTPLLFAQRGMSTLHVRLGDNSHLRVSLDSRRFDKHGTSLTIGDLPAGKHYLEVYALDGDERGRGQLVYRGYVKVHRGSYAECVIDPNTGDIQVNEEADNGNSKYSYSQQQRGNGDERDGRQYEEQAPPQDDIYANGDKNDRGGDNRKPDNADAPAIGSFGTGAMSKGDMDGLKSMVRGKDGDNEKVQTMETELKGKSFTTEQVSKMMSWLSGDDSRLELAEWAYPQTTDKDNYRKLGSAFTKGSYLKDLDDFIDSRK
jgi:hypothetical protein